MSEKGDSMNTLFIDTHDEVITVSFVLGSDIFTKEVCEACKVDTDIIEEIYKEY